MDEVSPSTAVSTSVVVPSPPVLAASTATPIPDITDTSTSSSSSSDQLSTALYGIAAGGVIGGILGIVFIVVVVVVVVRRKRKKKDYTPPAEEVKENVAYGVAATGGSELEKNVSYGAFSEFTFCLRQSSSYIYLRKLCTVFVLLKPMNTKFVVDNHKASLYSSALWLTTIVHFLQIH